MKFNGSYSDCFYQLRKLLRSKLVSHFMWAEYCIKHRTFTWETISIYADDLTVYNELFGSLRFVKFRCFC